MGVAAGPTLYPVDYGALCGIHVEPGSASCWNLTTGEELPPSEKASWCDSPWCYVGLCTCENSDASVSSYFPNTSMQYSYSTCDGTDTYTTGTSALDFSTCHGGAPEGTCTTPGHCSCPCVGTLPPEILVTNCSEDYAASGECVTAAVSNSSVLYPSNYGLLCKRHVEPGWASCWNLSTGEELPSSEKATWCDSPWCYVGLCSCESSDAAPSGYFSEVQRYYSYATCEGTDTFTTGVANVDHSTCYGGEPEGTCTTPGHCSCPCVGALPPEITSSTCSQDYAFSGECVTATVSNSSVLYPADYGSLCKRHVEPGWASCWNLTTGEELPPSEKRVGATALGATLVCAAARARMPRLRAIFLKCKGTTATRPAKVLILSRLEQLM